MRPSRWLLLTTVLGVAGYLALDPPRRAEPVAWPEDTVPVVVRRSAPPAPERGAALVGRLLDRLGWPVANARIELAELAPGGEPVVSDERGAFVLTAPAFRPHRVRIAAPGHEPVVCWMSPRETLVLALQEALPWSAPEPPAPAAAAVADRERLTGEGFLHDEAGQPIPFGVVTVAETGARATADEHGRFRIALPDGPATLVAFDEGGRAGRLGPVESSRKQGLVPLPDLVLAKGVAVRGYLVDSEGNPTAGAALSLSGGGVHRQNVTDDSGAFAFTGLLGGEYALEALPHRGSLGFRRPLTVGGGDVDVELALTPARPLNVEVVGAQGPVSDVWVVAEECHLRRAHALTDAAGKAELTGLGPGPFEWEVRESDGFDPIEVVDYDEQSSRLTVRAP